MLGPLVAAQFDLEHAIAELTRSGAGTGIAQSQLLKLGLLQREIGKADGLALVAIHASVAGLIAETQTIVQQGRDAIAQAQTGEAATLTSLVAASRAQVDAVMHGMKDFDRDLQFASTEDETEYRRREAERRDYIATQQAKGTPQGGLNAAGAAVGQMADAAAHGAGDSPEFKRRWNDLVATTAKLRAAAKANGVSTEEFDRRLRDDLRHILKAKGLSDAEIDKHFAANPDPLEAAKAFVSEQDLNEIGARKVSAQELTSQDSQGTATMKAASPPPSSSMADAMAKFGASGVIVSDSPSDAAPAHGLTVQVATAPTPSRMA